MNTCCLSKDIRAHNRRVSGDPLAREIFNHAAKRSDTCLVYSERHAHLIAQRHGNLGKRGVSCPLAETVYCAMNRVDADFHRREGIGRCEAVEDVAPTVFVKDARYDQMMAAFGGVGVYATTPDELTRAVNEAMDSGKPTLVNAVIDENAGTESGRIGNLNPQSVVSKK